MKRIVIVLSLLCSPALAGVEPFPEGKEPDVTWILKVYDEHPSQQEEIEKRAQITANAFYWANMVLKLRNGPDQGPIYCLDRVYKGVELIAIVREEHAKLPKMHNLTLAPALLMAMRNRFPCQETRD